MALCAREGTKEGKRARNGSLRPDVEQSSKGSRDEQLLSLCPLRSISNVAPLGGRKVPLSV